MLPMPASPSLRNDPLLFLVLLTLSISQLTMLVALCSSSFQNDLEAPLHLHMLPEVVALQVLSQVVCKLCHMSLYQQEETMDIPITILVITKIADNTTLLVITTVNHTFSLSSKHQLDLRTTVVHLPSAQDLEVLGHNTPNNSTEDLALKHTLDHHSSQCKAWFLASH